MTSTVTKAPNPLISAPTAAAALEDSTETDAKRSIESIVKGRELTWVDLLSMAQKSLNSRGVSSSESADSDGRGVVSDLCNEWNPTCADLEKDEFALAKIHQNDGNCMFYALYEACDGIKLKKDQSTKNSVNACNLRQHIVQRQKEDLANRCQNIKNDIEADITQKRKDIAGIISKMSDQDGNVTESKGNKKPIKNLFKHMTCDDNEIDAAVKLLEPGGVNAVENITSNEKLLKEIFGCFFDEGNSSKSPKKWPNIGLSGLYDEKTDSNLTRNLCSELLSLRGMNSFKNHPKINHNRLLNVIIQYGNQR
jgi:hypothetical protein